LDGWLKSLELDSPRHAGLGSIIFPSQHQLDLQCWRAVGSYSYTSPSITSRSYDCSNSLISGPRCIPDARASKIDDLEIHTPHLGLRLSRSCFDPVDHDVLSSKVSGCRCLEFESLADPRHAAGCRSCSFLPTPHLLSSSSSSSRPTSSTGLAYTARSC
jgi:hypothetical protein